MWYLKCPEKSLSLWRTEKIPTHKGKDTNADITQSLELRDKDFKAAIKKMLQQEILKTLEINGNTESLSKK